MKIIKLLCLIICTALCLTLFSGCSSNDSYIIYFELDSAPKTLDPQLVSTASEEILTRNLFEGLMRQNENGEIVKGAAKDYSVSNDGKTYTFTLRDGIKWSDGTDLKAKDFVFGFERAVDPKNKAPYVASLYGIVGAKDIATSKKSGGLGVTASSDNTLTIKLIKPDPTFLKLLTTAICMPCRKDVYEKAKGQYGITADNIVSNGSYRIRFWDKESKFSLRINKNEEYQGDFSSEATAVIFNVGEIDGRAIRVDEGNVDMGFVNLNEVSDKSNLITFEKSCYGLLINKSGDFGALQFRKAFAKSIHRKRLKNELGKSLTEATTLVPNTILLDGKPLSSQMAIAPLPEYNPTAAHNHYIEGAKDNKNLPKAIELIYFGDDDIKNLAALIAENLQQSLGTVVNITATDSEASLINRISLGEYQLALAPITAKSDDPAVFFEQFTKNSNDNIYGFKNASFDAEVAKITPNTSSQTVINAATNAEKLIIKDISVLPLAFRLEGLAYGKQFNCPLVSPFGGVIDLALITKVD